MLNRKGIKRWVKSKTRLYNTYTKIRYGSHTRIRDWVLKTQKFVASNDLCAFVFEQDGVYVRTDRGHEFRYIPELMGGLLGLEYKSGFESEDVETVLEMLPAHAVIIDIGANFGMYSISIAAELPNTTIFAFEPVPKTAQLLAGNVQRNKVNSQITVENLAVGKEVGNLSITADRYAGNYLDYSNSYSGEAVSVNVVDLDSYVNNSNIDRIDFIKVDVEGAELLVVQGAEEVLRKFRPTVMLEIAADWTKRFGYTPFDLVDYMRSLGYICEKFEAEGMAHRDSGSCNFFFVPEKK